jgi:hypothetical protein
MKERKTSKTKEEPERAEKIRGRDRQEELNKK